MKQLAAAMTELVLEPGGISELVIAQCFSDQSLLSHPNQPPGPGLPHPLLQLESHSPKQQLLWPTYPEIVLQSLHIHHPQNPHHHLCHHHQHPHHLQPLHCHLLPAVLSVALMPPLVM